MFIMHATLIRGSIQVCRTSSILPSIYKHETSLHHLKFAILFSMQILLFSNVFNPHATCFNIIGTIQVSQTEFVLRKIKIKHIHLVS